MGRWLRPASRFALSQVPNQAMRAAGEEAAAAEIGFSSAGSVEESSARRLAIPKLDFIQAPFENCQ